MKLSKKTASAVLDDIIPSEFIYDEDWRDTSAEFDLIGAIAYTNGDYDELYNSVK